MMEGQACGVEGKNDLSASKWRGYSKKGGGNERVRKLWPVESAWEWDGGNGAVKVGISKSFRLYPGIFGETNRSR